MTAPAERDKLIEAVAKLISLTQQGRLAWSTANREGVPDDGSERRYDSFFTADYNDQRLRIYRALSRAKPSGSIESVFAKGPVTTWVASPVLQFIDERGRTLWSFPSNPAIKDLLAAVQYQAAGVNKFLDRILNED